MIKLTQEIETTDEDTLLGEIFSRLHTSASSLGISEYKIKMNNIIFDYVKHETFMIKANETLTNLIILMCNSTQIVHDTRQRQKIIIQYHENEIIGGHFGHRKTLNKMKQLYFWPKMSQQVADFIRNCEKCKINKHKPHTKEEMTITQTPNQPFDTVIIDTVGPLTTSDNGNKYALTMICDLSKFLITVPMGNKEAQTIAGAIFENLILVHGPMKVMRTDLGSEFNNEVIRELCKLMNVEHKMSTAYHHETVGTIERNHRVLNEYFRSYLIDNNWEIHLKNFTFCYNISNNSAVNHEYTPYEIVYGRKCNLPSTITKTIDPLYNIDNYVKTQKYLLQNIHSRVQKLIENSKIQNKKQYDKKTNPIEIAENDMVLLKKEPYEKLKSVYSGPYKVTKIEHPNVIININGKPYKTHKNRLIKA